MPKYIVSIPITGVVHVEVDADDKQSAIDLAFENMGDSEDIEWEGHEIVCDGNVFHGAHNELNIQKLED